ncbi:hypothetical protein BTR14_12850 [Rhizobium rhizosphaerae]|uniref:Antitoxin n=1 Tax=Xaviernesmea rhizosphaerae TaxID=1672749 RepID=A0ABX3PC06_9HYPH|nr:hypothetical protein [Xaviernesmea rhizosphaerae]OQP85970.1 hypothetical protein BTR14_12850 [Xaviernesmea rhizosphaerae]
MAQADRRWTQEDARSHLDDLLQKARDEGPQHVDLGDSDGVVVISRKRYAALTGWHRDLPLVDFLESLDLDGIDLSRKEDRGRDVSLP